MTGSLAAIVTGPRTLATQKRPAPDPGPGEVRVTVDGCGVCGSNRPVWEGRPWFQYPLAPGAPGHEAWGRIESVGPDVAGLSAGQPVALLSERSFVQAETVSVDSVVALPDEMAGRPFPGEAFGCGFNVARRAEFRPGQTVAVIGIGFLGAVVAQRAVSAGANVVAISRRPFSLEVARRLGVEHTILLEDHHHIINTVQELTEGQWCDTVVEAIGTQWPLDLAAELTATRGRLVIAGFHQDGPRQVDMQLWNWRGIDVINAHERDRAVVARGIEDAAAAIVSGELDPLPLLTHEYELADLGSAFDSMIERPGHFLKALVVNP